MTPFCYCYHSPKTENKINNFHDIITKALNHQCEVAQHSWNQSYKWVSAPLGDQNLIYSEIVCHCCPLFIGQPEGKLQYISSSFIHEVLLGLQQMGFDFWGSNTSHYRACHGKYSTNGVPMPNNNPQVALSGIVWYHSIKCIQVIAHAYSALLKQVVHWGYCLAGWQPIQ